MTIRRVAVLFDNTARPETTGFYCRRALGQFVDVEHFLPTDLARLPRRGFDLYLAVDDGLHYPLPANLHPSAYWAIDTHLDFEGALQRARQFDLVFSAQKDGAEQLRQAGIAKATWLPLACDPEIHRKQEVIKRFDVAFVGNVLPGERAELVELVQRRFQNSFVGQRYLEEMAKAYSESRIVFNRSVRNDVNMRVFEALACGSLLVTNDLAVNGQGELFQDGVHLATYQNADDLLDKLWYYLRHDDLRDRIAAAGRRRALAKHTYVHRMRTILEATERQTSRMTVAVPASAERAKERAYFEFDRPEVLALVPTDARRVLDIGCGAGRLGEGIKNRQPAHVTGIELDAIAAASSERKLDSVIVGNVETRDVDFPNGSFDCVVCADVLEHLREPRPVLEKVRRWLTPEGTLVASIPNVRNQAVIRALLDGNWTYESAGLLDQDHVRFFTRREIEKLLFRCGFAVHSVQAVPGDGYNEWDQTGRPAHVSAGRLQIQVTSSNDAAEFFAYQWLVTARPDLGIGPLARAFPWPDRRPEVSIPSAHLGWLTPATQEMFKREVTAETRVILELGSWLGQSTRYLADLAPQSRVIAVDHWQGSPEHHSKPEFAALLPTLYETFFALNWEYRERIVPLRMTTLEGLRTAARFGIRPDVIYVDAEHSSAAVAAELDLCHELFPHARIVGDDWDDPGVQRAVKEFAAREQLSAEPVGDSWRAWRLVGDVRPFKPAETEPGLTSIILVTYNQLAYTRLCLDSIRLRTDEPHELIVVDNGSTDGTVEYIRSLENVTVIANADNRGFPAAANQGLRAAKGSNLLLLNNDTVVTTGWMKRMLDALHRAPDIGLIGPVSNQVSGEQQIPVSYDRLESLDGFAWEWGKANHQQTQSTDRLVGFCLLFRRDVLDRIGLLDERFGIGNFEDDDYCRRALQAGYRCLIARDAFVHHFGGRTFIASGVDFTALMEENRQKYSEKWASSNAAVPQLARPDPVSPRLPSVKSVSAPLREPPAHARFTLGESESPGLRLQKECRPRLSLCMIVRDNERTIGPCLESIGPYVDEIVVVDTGSKDKTPDICLDHGARLFHFRWCDDFSAARNESLRHARGDWIFWMDSDDTIPATCGQKLRELVDGSHSDNILGYIAQVHCPGTGDEGIPDVTVVDHVKLIRDRPDLRFEGRIHEQLLPAIRRAGGDVAWTDLYVIHSGADHSPETRRRKLERDLRILNQELKEKPDHPFVLFNLGMTYADAQRFDEAIDHLRRCIAVSHPEESHLRKAYALLASTLSQSDRHDDARVAAEEGLELYPDDKELLFRTAMLHHHFGRLEEAERTYLRVVNDTEERHFTSVDQGLATYKARHNLALVYEDSARFTDAERQWRRIVEEVPDYAAGWRGLGNVLLQQRNYLAAEHLASDLLTRCPRLRREGLLLNGRLSAARGDVRQAVRDLQAVDADHPEDLEALRTLCRILFEQGEPEAAQQALQELTHRAPDDAAAWHNLGSIRLQLAHYKEAVMALRRSLDIRPDSETARHQLAQALRFSMTPGQIGETIELGQLPSRSH